MSLKFKGDDGGPAGKKKKKDKKRKREDEEDGVDVEAAPIIAGSGRIVSSGETVNGFNTLFKDEIALGDLLRILHPGTLLPESRAVTQIMGNRSLMLVAPFSANFSSTTEYQIERVSELIKAKAEAKAGKQAGGGEDGGEDEDAFDNHMKEQLEKTLKKQRQTVQIREKVYGGPGVTYKTVTKEVGKDMTAEERLNMREKEGRDKYCW